MTQNMQSGPSSNILSLSLSLYVLGNLILMIRKYEPDNNVFYWFCILGPGLIAKCRDKNNRFSFTHFIWNNIFSNVKWTHINFIIKIRGLLWHFCTICGLMISQFLLMLLVWMFQGNNVWFHVCEFVRKRGKISLLSWFHTELYVIIIKMNTRISSLYQRRKNSAQIVN